MTSNAGSGSGRVKDREATRLADEKLLATLGYKQVREEYLDGSCLTYILKEFKRAFTPLEVGRLSCSRRSKLTV